MYIVYVYIAYIYYIDNTSSARMYTHAYTYTSIFYQTATIKTCVKSNRIKAINQYL